MAEPNNTPYGALYFSVASTRTLPGNVMTWPLVLYFAFVILLVTAVIVVSFLLGQRHSEHATGEPYEGGIVSEGSARVRFSLRYSLVAMLFVIFDLEAVFLFAWAGAARELGWPGYAAVVLFVATLAAALVYVWRVGALDWARKTWRLRQR
jgi:NADH-quinone oxidoreductase subunit A